jgi:hypothetical protein
MTDGSRFLYLALGLLLSAGLVALGVGSSRSVRAASDHFEDYIMCTGAVSADMFRTGIRFDPVTKTYHSHLESSPVEGLWLLDYRSGKLLGTAIDRTVGKVIGWGEVDLVKEFALAPRQDVHFTMVTGDVARGQSALYVAETTTGKMGVYSMGPGPTGGPGIVILRHDQVPFRSPTR